MQNISKLVKLIFSRVLGFLPHTILDQHTKIMKINITIFEEWGKFFGKPLIYPTILVSIS